MFLGLSINLETAAAYCKNIFNVLHRKNRVRHKYEESPGFNIIFRYEVSLYLRIFSHSLTQSLTESLTQSVTLARKRCSGLPTRKVYKKRIVLLIFLRTFDFNDFDIRGHFGGRIGGQIGHPKLKSTYLFIRLSYMHKV